LVCEKGEVAGQEEYVKENRRDARVISSRALATEMIRTLYQLGYTGRVFPSEHKEAIIGTYNIDYWQFLVSKGVQFTESDFVVPEAEQLRIGVSFLLEKASSLPSWLFSDQVRNEKLTKSFSGWKISKPMPPNH
jgi:hypothetical protein